MNAKMNAEEIVAGLRNACNGCNPTPCCEYEVLGPAAADTIERLQAENNALSECKEKLISQNKRLISKCGDFDRLQAENAALKEANRWIPVSKRMPEDGTNILVANAQTGTQYVSHKDLIYFSENKDAFVPTSYLHEFEFTHWRALPEPPQKG